ncbi:DUF6973 domain-containing protein [Embleya sp. NPDC020886]|uniref:DUF6973 domain-containing protein n=1 Tax=Embleya sp. NPDC020886 TaxID=3363980 RepID=UPI0037B8B5F4
MSDVRALVPGDPMSVRTAAGNLLLNCMGAGRANETLGRVVEQTSATWKGTAAEGLRAELGVRRARLTELSDRVGVIVQALYGYADALATAQATAGRCLEIAAQLGMDPVLVEQSAMRPELLIPQSYDCGPTGRLTDADMAQRAGLAQEFNRLLAEARGKAVEADYALERTMRVPLNEIATQYQVGDQELVDFAPNPIESRIPHLNDRRPASEQAMLLELSTEERALYMLIGNQAWEECRKRFPGQGELEGHADAFRHTYWNALLVRNFGPEWTARYTTAHEMGADPDPLKRTSESMDLFNNEVGRRVAVEANGKSTEELADMVEHAVRNGQTVVVGADGQLTYSDYVPPGRTWDADRKGKTESFDV